MSVVAAPLTVRRHKALPGSRAILGGLLVTAAAVGTFAVYSGSNQAPTTNYVVVARDVTAGTELQPSDLKLVAMDLDPSVADGAFTTTEKLATGVIALDTMKTGELVQSSDVAAADTTSTEVELSLAIDPAWSLGNRLVPGSRVDILNTDDALGETYLVAEDVRVLDVLQPDAGLGTQQSIVVLAVSDISVAATVTSAGRAGTVSLVRATPGAE